MAGAKHALPNDDADEAPQCLSMFEGFRSELDEHHDRRERVIKASRDITALSKKIIFSLQRVRSLRQPLPPNITKTIEPFRTQINELFSTVSSDLQQINAYRYHRQISPGMQEYIEATAFEHYLSTQSLISYREAQDRIPGNILLTEDDYLLGLFDLVGELMRSAITGMATSGTLPGSTSPDTQERRDMLVDMQALRMGFERLDLQGSGLRRDAEKKMEVMQTCVEKVEKAAYGLKIRGKERPKGWIPDMGGDDKREAIESY